MIIERLYSNLSVSALKWGLTCFPACSQVRSGQFPRRLWGSTRRISQVSSGETEYNPTENAGKWDEQWWKNSECPVGCRYLHLQDAGQTWQGFPPFTCWETILFSHWYLWESNYTLSTFFILKWFDILLRISFTVVYCFQSASFQRVALFCGFVELGVWGCELLLDCIYSHISGMWLMLMHVQPQTQTEVTLWTAQTPCSWVLSCQRNSCNPYAVECPKVIVWKWRLLIPPGNLKTTVDVARDFHTAILVNTTRGLTL